MRIKLGMRGDWSAWLWSLWLLPYWFTGIFPDGLQKLIPKKQNTSSKLGVRGQGNAEDHEMVKQIQVTIALNKFCSSHNESNLQSFPLQSKGTLLCAWYLQGADNKEARECALYHHKQIIGCLEANFQSYFSNIRERRSNSNSVLTRSGSSKRVMQLCNAARS